MRVKKGCYRNRKEHTEGKEGSKNDFFPTYHALTRLYLGKVKFDINDEFLEPCAGNSDITKILKESGYHNITEYDIFPRNKSVIEANFLKDSFHDCDHIVTNPPFKLSIEFIEKSSKVATKTISFLWPLDYLHGVERFSKIYENGINGFYLDTVYPFVRRPLFDKKYRPDGLMPTGATSFAWFKFSHKYHLFNAEKRTPGIIHLHNNENMGVPTMADELTFQDLI